jgi:methylmalonyl-CoA mutase cobalamin-binding subunit
MRKILLAPLDPVHDNAVKLLDRRLSDVGFETITLPPGATPEEVIETALHHQPKAILVSRTLGYKAGEILGHLVDLAEASGIRETTKLGIGGMAITEELGAELGFDAVFVGSLNMSTITSFLMGEQITATNDEGEHKKRTKADLVGEYSYKFKDPIIESLLDEISDQILTWVKGKTSPGVERAKIREEMIAEGVLVHNYQGSKAKLRQRLLDQYISFCGSDISAFYKQGKLPSGVRWLRPDEIDKLPELLNHDPIEFNPMRHIGGKTNFFIQYGTGCPVMDLVHIKTCEAWGIDGFIHICPSWAARSEGLLEGYLTHKHDGTILTLENLGIIHHYMDPESLWVIRGHRGLNTPEALVLGHASGADLLKINIPYGSTAGGTDPERLTVDGIYCLQLAARYGVAFDIPGNTELSGVPPHKTFASLLIMMALALKVGAKPIPKPLLCYSPYMEIYGHMDDNMVDVNAAKLGVWQEIIDTPVWAGEPVGFMSHTSDRVQSSVTTAAHAALASTMGVSIITIASSDEAYSKGPISLQARIDHIRATKDLLRFFGSSEIKPTPHADIYQAKLHQDIITTLQNVAERKDFIASLYEGALGDKEDGLYPGRVGRNTVASNVSDIEQIAS